MKAPEMYYISFYFVPTNRKLNNHVAETKIGSLMLFHGDLHSQWPGRG